MKKLLLDAHCDTLWHSEDIYDNDVAHICLKKGECYDAYAQFFAIFCTCGDPETYPTLADQTARAKEVYGIETGRYEAMLANYPETVVRCRNYADLCAAKAAGKIGAFLSVEGAEQTLGRTVDEIYADGVRMLTLTWNYKNFVGGTNLTGGGITEEGKAFVRSLQEKGIIVDLSHGSEELFWDVLKITKKPFIASHSNARTICRHVRNLTDEQFKALIRIGGVSGINLCDVFIRDGGNSTIEDVCHHIEHFLSLGGENNIAMGADLDGVGALPAGISHVDDLHKIGTALHERGISETVIEKIFWGNLERVIKECL